MKKVFFPLFQTGCWAISYLFVPIPVFAQDITPDGTTATEVKSPDGQNFDIGGGDRAGGNLFHSFGNFGVPNGGSANFLNSPDVVNIINRVTGGKLSDIQGIISAQGAANLFLINPAGIVFGPNASLNIGGSFLGSTADRLVFPDGEFSAVNAEGKPLLTINAPIGLGIRDNPAPITNNSNVGLQVKPGQNITLVGGNLDFNGGKIIAPGGTVNLGSLGVAGTVGLNENGSLTFSEGVQRGDITLKNGASVNVRAGGNGFINVNAKNLTLSEGSELFAGIEENQGSPDAVGGDINIDATDKVTLIGSQTEYPDPDKDPDKPNDSNNNQSEEDKKIIKEGLAIEKEKGTGIRNTVGLTSVRRNDGSDRSSAKGNGGNITIKTGKLELIDVVGIEGSLYGEGKGTNIGISATDISFNGLRSYIASSVQGANFGTIQEKASGTSGDININTNTLNLNGFAGISTRVSDDGATGKAGNITIKASDRVTLNNGSFILSQVGKGAIGDGGNIAIDTKNISFTGGKDKSGIYADTKGTGNAGNIFIKASDSVLLDQKALLLSQVAENAIGNAGNIEIETGNLSLKGESQILADTKGKGDAGKISVKASDLVSLDAQTKIVSQVASGAIGNGGNIEISGKNINFNNKGVALDSSTQGKGQDGNPSQGGNIILKATENINLDNSLFLSQIRAGGIGNAGNIEIETGNLSLKNGSLLNSETTGKGNAGNINVKASGNIDLSAGSLFVSSVGVNLDYSDPKSPKPDFDEQKNLKVGEGNAGNINIDTTNLNLKDSLLISNTQGKGNAGDININAKDTISLDGKNGNSLILSSVEIATSNQKPILNNEGIAFTGEGNAGNINITTNNLTLTGKREPKPKDCCKSLIIADTKGVGSAGDININATGKISLDRDSLILAAVEEPKIEEGIQTTPGGEGQAGNITITTGDLNLNNQSYIIADTKNKGDAGNIKIDATGNISLDTGSKIVTATGSRGIKGQIEGNAGQIDITANSLSLNDFSVIGANTNRKAVRGEAKDINITTTNDLSLTNGSLISALTENDFKAGNITINAQNLELASGGKIVTGTDGKGSAGNINLNIAKDIKIDGSNPPEKPSANVIYDKYYPENENELNDTKTEFLFREKILKDLAEQKYTGLFAGGTDTSTGNTGTISIGASNIRFQNNGNITAAAAGGATGGNISIQADSVVADNTNNNIEASADRERGGEIKIETPTAWGWTVGRDNSQTSDIDATSNVEGKDGIVNITASDFQSNQEVVESPQNVVEVEQIEAQACSDARNVAQTNTFAILGRGDVENGTQPLNSSLIRVSQKPGQESDKQSNHPQLSDPQQKPLSSDEIIPARGVAMNEKGQIVLTRYPTPKATDRTPVRSPWCQARD
jgi:filamentous hemagglutinin family protein